MNTVEKGNIFEDRAFEIIKKAVNEGSLGIKENIKFYRKKSYYSNTRKKDIKFDITIEVWPPGAKRFALIYFIECKNYSSSVPVDDIEVFYQQAEGVAEGCFKCVFIANNAFQEGLQNFAETKRIMLIRAEDSGNDFEILLHRANLDISNIPKITKPLDEKNSDFGVDLIEKLIDKSIKNSFRQKLQNNQQLYLGISEFSKHDIENIAKREIKKMNPNILSNGIALEPRKLEKYIKEEHGIKIGLLENESSLLGSCNIKNKTICVHPSLIGTKRYLFVLAHEFGHYILHKEIKMEQSLYESFSDPEINFKTNRYELTNAKHWIEWQANYFASSFVLPDVAVVFRLFNFQDKNNLSRRALYVDDQPENRRIYNKVLDHLSYFFEVTKTSIIYRLKELNMLENNSRLKSIGQLISEFPTEIF